MKAWRGHIRTYSLFSMGRGRFYGFFISRNHDLPVDWNLVREKGLKILMNYEQDISLHANRPRHPFEEEEEEAQAASEAAGER